jgi:hypothetical protein
MMSTTPFSDGYNGEDVQTNIFAEEWKNESNDDEGPDHAHSEEAGSQERGGNFLQRPSPPSESIIKIE